VDAGGISRAQTSAEIVGILNTVQNQQKRLPDYPLKDSEQLFFRSDAGVDTAIGVAVSAARARSRSLSQAENSSREIGRLRPFQFNPVPINAYVTPSGRHVKSAEKADPTGGGLLQSRMTAM